MRRDRDIYVQEGDTSENDKSLSGLLRVVLCRGGVGVGGGAALGGGQTENNPKTKTIDIFFENSN